LTEDDRELGWVLGEWKAHSSQSYVTENGATIQWEEILDLVSFTNQTRIVKELWRRDFKKHWLNYLVSHPWKRKGFLALVDAAEKFCRRCIESRQQKRRPSKLCHRYTNLKPQVHRFLFPTSHYIKKQGRNFWNGDAFKSSFQRQRIYKTIQVTVVMKGVKPSKYEALVKWSHTWKKNPIDRKKVQSNITQSVSPSIHKQRESFPTSSPSEHEDSLSPELEELAFLLEEACNISALCPWKHVETNMSNDLRNFLNQETEWVLFCKRPKIRSKKDERFSPRQQAFETLRETLRKKIILPPKEIITSFVSPKDLEGKLDHHEEEEKREEAMKMTIQDKLTFNSIPTASLESTIIEESMFRKKQDEQLLRCAYDYKAKEKQNLLDKQRKPTLPSQPTKVDGDTQKLEDNHCWEMGDRKSKNTSDEDTMSKERLPSPIYGSFTDNNNCKSRGSCSENAYNFGGDLAFADDSKGRNSLLENNEVTIFEDSNNKNDKKIGMEDKKNHNAISLEGDCQKRKSIKANKSKQLFLQNPAVQLEQKKPDSEYGTSNQMPSKEVKVLNTRNRLQTKSTQQDICKPLKVFHEIPIHVVGDTDGSVVGFTSDITNNEDDSACHQLNSVQGAKSYVSELRSYQLFSSSMRREAQLLLHISQWKTWHMTNHSNTQLFSKTQETIVNAFRDDEILLSKQAFQRAFAHIPIDQQSLIDMANDYSNLREKMWIWWYGLVQGCCMEFAAQFPRVWNDFEYTQRSLWEYVTHLESAMREHHFDECLHETIKNGKDMREDRSNFLKQPDATTNFLPVADARQYLKSYVTSLNKYLDMSTSVRNKMFFKAYSGSWKLWEKKGRINEEAFLEHEELRLEKYRVDEMTLLDSEFRSPYLRGLENSLIRPLFSREIELYLTIREKLWLLFCCDILWPSWKEAVQNKEGLDRFFKSQERLWDFFQKMEVAIMKIHGNRCTQLTRSNWPHLNTTSPLTVAMLKAQPFSTILGTTTQTASML